MLDIYAASLATSDSTQSLKEFLRCMRFEVGMGQVPLFNLLEKFNGEKPFEKIAKGGESREIRRPGSAGCAVSNGVYARVEPVPYLASVSMLQGLHLTQGITSKDGAKC